MNTNQEILDRFLRHKILLLGFSKHLADQIVAYLKQTEPEIRELLLAKFGLKVSGRTLLARLREAEARLRSIRGKAWKRSYEHVYAGLLEMAEEEPEEIRRTVGEPIPVPDKGRLPVLVASTLIAGQKLKELFQVLEESDVRRIITQVRIGAMGDDSITKLLSRVTGRLSYAAAAAGNAARAATATAVATISDAVRYAVVGLSAHLFDYEIWISILDSATTVECRKLHRKVFPVGEGPFPGFHYHCRSGRYALSRAGGAVAAATYATWIATQEANFRKIAGEEFSYNNLKSRSLDEAYEDE